MVSKKSPAPHEYCIGTLPLGEMKSEGDYITAKKEMRSEASGGKQRYCVAFASLALTTS